MLILLKPPHNISPILLNSLKFTFKNIYLMAINCTSNADTIFKKIGIMYKRENASRNILSDKMRP